MTGSGLDHRGRLIAGAADMLSRRGLNATSIRHVAAHSQAPLGSTYHYFPGGKQQLVTEAVQAAGEVVRRSLDEQLEAGPLEGLRAFLALWRDTVVSSEFRAGCPVLAVSVEEPVAGDTTALEAAADVFRSWESLLAGSLRSHGAGPKEARQVATLVVAAVEGTVALCRAKRSAQPLDDVTAQLEHVVVSVLRD